AAPSIYIVRLVVSRCYQTLILAYRRASHHTADFPLEEPSVFLLVLLAAVAPYESKLETIAANPQSSCLLLPYTTIFPLLATFLRRMKVFYLGMRKWHSPIALCPVR